MSQSDVGPLFLRKVFWEKLKKVFTFWAFSCILKDVLKYYFSEVF